MKSIEDPLEPTQEDRFDQLVADYVKAVEDGQSPDRDCLLSEHPDLADELREFFEHRDRMENLIDPFRSAAAKVLTVRCPNCHDTVELHDETKLSDLDCSSCGTRFSLIPDEAANEFPNGLRQIGQFELLEVVGAGEFGKVWKAHDASLQRIVAVKIPRRGRLNSIETEMFLRDARLAAQLKHPNIVTVHEVGKQDSMIYIVSDFIEGCSLKQWIQQNRFTPSEAAELTLTLASGLAHAHEAGVIHRDLKPGNIMLDTRGTPYIVDFGLAKRDNSEVTMTEDGQILGTPAYMSPEQARGDSRHVDPRSDIYSLGVILFELLTGELPFRGQLKMLIFQILHDDPPSPRRLNANVTRDLETICLKCLEKDPAKRYPNTRELVEDLHRSLANEPIRARPLTTAERLIRWCGRNRKVAALATSLFVLLFTVTVISPLVAIHQAKLRRDREQALDAQRLANEEAREATIHALLHSTTAELPEVLRSLSRYGSEIDPLLSAQLNSESLTRRQVLHIQLARLRYGSDSVLSISRSVRTERITPNELRAICETVRDSVFAESTRQQFRELWACVQDVGVPTRQRVQAATVLANVDPESKRWAVHSVDLANFLATRPPLEISDWVACLAPVGKSFRKPLESVFRAAKTESERTAAMTGLICLLGDETDSIVEYIKVAEPGDLPAIIRHLESQPQIAIEKLTQELAEGRTFTTGELAGDWQMSTECLTQLLASESYISERFIVCLALPIDEFPGVCESLRKGRYTPSRCKPYRNGRDVTVSAIWLRDTFDWTVAGGLTPSQVEARSKELLEEEQYPQDIASYVDEDGELKFVGIWKGDPTLAPASAFTLGLPRNRWQSDVNRRWKAGFRPETVHVFYPQGSGELRSILWRKSGRGGVSMRSFLPSRFLTVETQSPVHEVVMYFDEDRGGVSYGGIRYRDSDILSHVETGLSSTQFLDRCETYDRNGYSPASLAVLTEGVEEAAVTCVWQRAKPQTQEQLQAARGRANLAIALFQLGADRRMLPLLSNAITSQVRTEIILRLAPARVDPETLITMLLEGELDSELQHTLLLSLSQYSTRSIPAERLQAFRTFLENVHQEHPDPGIHSASKWLMQVWFNETPVASREASIPRPGEMSWYTSPNGHTMAVLRVPVSRDEIDPLDHFDPMVLAVETSELTADVFKDGLPGTDGTRRREIREHAQSTQRGAYFRDLTYLSRTNSVRASGTGKLPADFVSWYDAVAYCEWLNEESGVPESQHCYHANEDRVFAEGLRVASDLSLCSGYRILANAEWRYVAAGRSDAPYFFGRDPRQLKHFGWSAETAGYQTLPVAQLMPNRFGLFDVHGNLAEWCHDSSSDDENHRLVIGGHNAQLAWEIQNNFAQFSLPPTMRSPHVGVRIGRTLLPSTRSVFARAESLAQSSQWEEARAEIESALKLRPDEWFYRCMVARLSAYLEDDARYREVCQGLVEQFLGDRFDEFTPMRADHMIAHEIVIACTIAPGAFDDWGDVIRLGRLAAKHRGRGGARSLAMALYRSGDYVEAARIFDEIAPTDNGLGGVAGRFFRSFTHQKLGNTALAEQCRADAVATVETLQQRMSGDYGDRWRVLPSWMTHVRESNEMFAK